jgi:choline dehydrogenase-like flavoprotein
MGYKSFLDARKIEPEAKLEFDLCIVGAGAAGITIAREFSNTNLRVCLLESGGLRFDTAVNRLSEIDDVGRLPGEEGSNRLRYFGGTTNHWGGHCVPLEPDDFEEQDWIPYSGWPYDYNELRPYYIRAHDVLGLGKFEYVPEKIGSELGFELFPFDKKTVATTVSRYNRVRFGTRYGDEIDGAKNIKVILYSDVSEIVLADSTANNVVNVLAQTIASNQFYVGAKYFVIACGAIENARLLLMSNRQRRAGIGNHSDLVGRFFQEHLSYSSGSIAPNITNPKLRFYLREWPYGDIGVRAHIAVPSDRIRELQIPKYRAEIVLVSVSSAYRHAKAIKHNVSLADVLALMSDPIGLGTVARCKSNAPPTGYLLINHVEQTPNPDSRVMLSAKKDPLNRPQPQLKWKLSPLDQEGVIRAQRLIAHEVGRSGFGRMQIEMGEGGDDFLEKAVGPGHQMGTTRMDNDPARGVTDGNAKVHFTSNLHVAGSSLFPRVGWANPTLTIVATSIRLADYLKMRFRAEGAL